jgi:hypothetical protein
MALVHITVSLDDDVVEWACLQAARKGMPPGRFLGQIVEKRMLELGREDGAARRGRGGKPMEQKNPG